MIPVVDTSPTIAGPIRGSHAKQIRDQVNANLSLSYSLMNGRPFIFVVVNQTQVPCRGSQPFFCSWETKSSERSYKWIACFQHLPMIKFKKKRKNTCLWFFFCWNNRSATWQWGIPLNVVIESTFQPFKTCIIWSYYDAKDCTRVAKFATYPPKASMQILLSFGTMVAPS